MKWVHRTFLGKLSLTELAWAAGFFDGEGSFCTVSPTSRQKGRSTIDITQSERSVLDRFNGATGSLGKVYGPYNKSSQLKKNYTSYQFRVTPNESVQAIIAMLWRFLSRPKKDQAVRVLQYVRSSRDGEGR